MADGFTDQKTQLTTVSKYWRNTEYTKKQ